MISLVVLPAFACMLMIGFPLFDKRTHLGNTRVVSSARLFRIQWLRCLVIALFFGAFVGFILGRQGFQPLLVGAGTTVVLMVPVTLILGARKFVLHRRKRRQSAPVLGVHKLNKDAPRRARADHNASTRSAASREAVPMGVASVELETAAASSGAPKLAQASKPDTQAMRVGVEVADTRESAERRVARQLEALDDNIRSYTLSEASGGVPYVAINGGTRGVATRPVREVPEMLDESSLQAYSRDDLESIVVRLFAEKRKYQRLVIAQKATLAAEREDHERTREIAIQATEHLSRSVLELRRTEKIARRERSQRLTLESPIVNVPAALINNAQSVLKQRLAQTQ